MGFCASIKAQSVKDVNLLEAIKKLQADTQYRFLYRESMVRSIVVSLDFQDDKVLNKLKEQLKTHSIDLYIDGNRNQILLLGISERHPRQRSVHILGQVVDDDTGERLPYASLTWKENGITRGIAASANGSFRLRHVSEFPFGQIKISHMGYEPVYLTLSLPLENNIKELTVRLKPTTISGSEILVTGIYYYSSKDTNLTGLVNSGKFSPMGESNAVRSLQVLPSIGNGTAMNDGLNVRGSSPDGFQVILDGMTIFNQSHMFGLLDSFNDDAISRNNFFYDVTPAQYSAPTGGTLSLITRTGSQNNHQFKMGVSNSSLKATAEGPIRNGESSWLASARHSYMNTLSWFSSSDIIKWGLDIDRPKSLLGEDLTDLNAEIVQPGDTEARFFDLHGKFYHEGRSGSRLMGSLYYGGDFTRQTAFRQARSFSSGITFEAENVETTNDWGNFVGSLHYQSELSTNATTHMMTGLSSYMTNYSKDDFTYTRTANIDGSNQLSMFTYPFVNQSTINEFKLEQFINVVFQKYGATTGAAYYYYLGDYSESSFDRPGYLKRSRASQFDAFLQVDMLETDPVNVQVGNRLYFYTAGNYIRWSPRIKMMLYPDSRISFGAGFSRNHQFLHRVALANAVTADIWILSDKEQPPSSVNHYSAGIYLQPINSTYVQVETYLKQHQNLWLHEINLQSFGNTFAETPWFYENQGVGKGVETLIRNKLSPNLTFTQSYTLSQMMLKNPFLFEGQSFYADWDRKHSYTASVELEASKDLLVNISWNLASGVPNRMVGSDSRGEGRLANYNRLDLSLHYMGQIKQGDLELKLSFFNLLNHRNPWYREYNLAVDRNSTIPRLTTVAVDVYDLGFQPSFELLFAF
ncbi:MAG: TonB-dependent receptor [Balneolales bacterium]